MRHRIVFVVLLLLSSRSIVLPQDHPNSPVFKDYRPTGPSLILEQSDATYQMWQGFLVTQKANAGDVLAQHELGIRYLMGRGFKADTAKGAYWIGKAAEKNLIPARYNRAILEYNGWGVEWNPFKAFKDFLYCAKDEMVQAQYILGQFYTDDLCVPTDWAQAYYWVKKAADAGDTHAQEALAEFAKHGYGSPATQTLSTKADTDSTKSETVGNSLSLVFLNVDDDTSARVSDATLLNDVLRESSPEFRTLLQKKGSDTLAVDSTGIRTIRMAAEHGSPEAQAILGRCYEKGLGIQQDAVAASVHYLRALRFNSPRAPALLWNLKQSRGYFDRLRTRIGKGDPSARYVWAGLIALNMDYQLTDVQALLMLEEAADSGYTPAIIELGLCYYSGRWVSKDVVKANELWQRAAGLGSEEGSVRIALAGLTEWPGRDDVGDALTVLDDAANDGSLLAEVGLAFCYENGIGVKKDWGKAADLYRRGAQRGSQDAYRALRRMYDAIRPTGKEFQLR